MPEKKPPKQRTTRRPALGRTQSEQRTLKADSVGRSIAERLRAYRIGLGLTVRALAARSGISPSMVSEA
jgi:ribosome-binding protein aMBF1 (putative translation factor)